MPRVKSESKTPELDILADDEVMAIDEVEKPVSEIEKEAALDDFNADNRRITKILRQDREANQIRLMKAQNRKLKQEVSRLKSEKSHSQA